MIVLPNYVIALKGSEADVGLVLGSFAFTALLSRPVVGRLVDTWGRKPVAMTGCFIFAVSPVLYIFASSVPVLIIMRMFHGLGISCFSTAGTTWVADIVPPARRGEAMGLYSNASQIALAFAPLIGSAIYAWAGFRVLFISSTLVATVSLLVAGVVHEQRREDVRGMPQGNFGQALGQRSILAMAFAMMTTAATWGVIISFLPVFSTQRGVGPPALFFTLHAAAAVGLRLVVGRLSDRMGRRIIATPAFVFLAMVMLAFPALSSNLFLYTLAVLYGMGFGVVYPTLGAFLVDVAPAHLRGSAVGVFTAGFDLGIAVGSYAGGLVAQWLGLEAAFVAAGLLALVGLAVLLGGTQEKRPSSA